MRNKEDKFVPIEIIPDRRQERTLSDSDVDAIAVAILNSEEHCRYKNIPPQDMMEAVKFAKKMNNVIEGGAGIVGKLILTAIVVYLLSLVGAGFVADMFSRLTK